MNLSIHQLKLDEVVGNITRTNSELFKSISGIAQSVSVFTDRQTSLYGALGSLISKENQQIGMLKVLADALERGLTLALEYESLTVQCALMNEAIARMQRLISSHFTGILDVSQVPVALLQQGLLENSELSLANVRTEFRYSATGYQIVHIIPGYSSPFFLYKLDQIPVPREGHWFGIEQEREIYAINNVHDFLDLGEVSMLCPRVGLSYLCKSRTVTVRRSREMSCISQLIAKHTTGQGKVDKCSPVKIHPGDKMSYIVKDSYLLIANPAAQDSLEVLCPDSSQSANYTVPNGLVKLRMLPTCSYSAADFYIPPSASRTTLRTVEEDLTEIRLASLVLSSEHLLDHSGLVDWRDPGLNSLLEKYSSQISSQGKTVDTLAREVKKLDTLEALTDYSPFEDLSDFSSPVSYLNWMLVSLIVILCTAAAVLMWMYCSKALCCKVTASITGAASRCCLWCSSWHARQEGAAKYSATGRDSPSCSVSGPRPSTPAAAPKRAGLYPEVEEALSASSLPEEDLVDGCFRVAWDIAPGPVNDLILAGYLQGQSGPSYVTFDLEAKIVRDLAGRALHHVQAPSDHLILAYLEHVKASPLPPLLIEKDNVVALKGHPAVHFKGDKGWVNVLTDKKVPGLRAPTPSERRESSL